MTKKAVTHYILYVFILLSVSTTSHAKKSEKAVFSKDRLMEYNRRTIETCTEFKFIQKLAKELTYQPGSVCVCYKKLELRLNQVRRIAS